MKARKNLYDAYNASYISKQEAYSKAQEKLESARRKAEKQNELLKRWFWVPGYGAYLAFDKLLNDQEADTRCSLSGILCLPKKDWQQSVVIWNPQSMIINVVKQKK